MPYKVGDHVKIKNELPNADHAKQTYAGTIMTVRKVVTLCDGRAWYYCMEEDYKWFSGFDRYWYDEEIAGYAYDFKTPEILNAPPSQKSPSNNCFSSGIPYVFFTEEDLDKIYETMSARYAKQDIINYLTEEYGSAYAESITADQMEELLKNYNRYLNSDEVFFYARQYSVNTAIANSTIQTPPDADM